MPHPLTAKEVQSAKARDRKYTLADGRGLYLQVKPNGRKYWIFKYRRPGSGRQNDISLGPADDLSLKDARIERESLRQMVRSGVDPAEPALDGRN